MTFHPRRSCTSPYSSTLANVKSLSGTIPPHSLPVACFFALCHSSAQSEKEDRSSLPQRAARLPLLANVEREAAKALAALRQEITAREKELATLKAEAARWQSVLHGSASGRGRAVTVQRRGPRPE